MLHASAMAGRSLVVNNADCSRVVSVRSTSALIGAFTCYVFIHRDNQSASESEQHTTLQTTMSTRHRWLGRVARRSDSRVAGSIPSHDTDGLFLR